MNKFCTKCGNKLKENTYKCEECGYISIDAGISNVAEKVKNYDYKGKFNQIKSFAKQQQEKLMEQKKLQQEAAIRRQEVEEEIQRQVLEAEQKSEAERMKSIVIKNSLSAKYGYSFTYGIKEFIERFNNALNVVINSPQNQKMLGNDDFAHFFDKLKIQSLNDFEYKEIREQNMKSVFTKNISQYGICLMVSTDEIENIEWVKIYCHSKYLNNQEWYNLSECLFVLLTIAVFNTETLETALFKVKEAEELCEYYSNNGSKEKGKSMSTQAQFIIDRNDNTDIPHLIYSYMIIPTNTGLNLENTGFGGSQQTPVDSRVLELHNLGMDKINIIKTIRMEFGLGLNEATALINKVLK